MDEVEVEHGKKRKIPLSELPGALPAVTWSPDRPRPELTPDIWTEEVGEEICKYIDWHRRHPHCLTPRKVKYGPNGEAIGGTLFHEADPTLAYSTSGYKEVPLPSHYLPSSLGVDGDLEEVSSVATRQAYEEKLLYNQLHDDDPWYNTSVKDELELSHVDGSFTTNKSKSKDQPPSQSSRWSEILAWQEEGGIGGGGRYQGGAPSYSQAQLEQLNAVALMDKDRVDGKEQEQEGQQGKKKKVSPWQVDRPTSRFTRGGSALDDYKKVALKRRVEEALVLYADEGRRKSKKESGSSSKSAKKQVTASSWSVPSSRKSQSSSVQAGSSKKRARMQQVAEEKDEDLASEKKAAVQRSHRERGASQKGSSRLSAAKGGRTASSAKIFPIEDLDPYATMRSQLGGQGKLDEMATKWIAFGEKVHHQVSGLERTKNDLFSFHLDLFEACEQLRLMKVRSVLIALEDGNVNTPDDEPLFLHLFHRTLEMDRVASSLMMEGKEYETTERKKIEKILELFLSLGKVSINLDKGKDRLAALHLAVMKENAKMVRWCLFHGADPEQLTKNDQMTPLMLAAKYGYVTLIAELVQAGVNIDRRVEEVRGGGEGEEEVVVPGSGMTGLHYAAAFGQTRTALFLLRIGANKKIRDCQARTAAEVAALGNYLATAQAISAYAEPERAVGPQLDYLIEQEKKKEDALLINRRRAAVTLPKDLQLTTLRLLHWKDQLVHYVQEGYRYLRKKLNLVHDRDRLEEEDGDEEVLDGRMEEAEIHSLDVTTMHDVVQLAAQSPTGRPIQSLVSPSIQSRGGGGGGGADDVMPFE
eukprot:scaffold1503_cov150-Ochromonas_danica.AAC.3